MSSHLSPARIHANNASIRTRIRVDAIHRDSASIRTRIRVDAIHRDSASF